MSIYEHARKAGNRGDVWKHFALLTVLDRSLADRADAPFQYRESHAGTGRFELRGTGEWRQGIGKVLPAADNLRAHPYFRIVGETLHAGDQYLGSWRLVARHLESEGVPFRMSLNDTSSAVSNLIWSEIERGELPPAIDFQQLDGFDELENESAADLILIDPPYKPAYRDWWRARKAAALLAERAASYLVWYPIHWPTHPERLVVAAGAPGYEVRWRPMGEKPSKTLKGCGVLAGGATAEALEAAREELAELASLMGGQLAVRRP